MPGHWPTRDTPCPAQRPHTAQRGRSASSSVTKRRQGRATPISRRGHILLAGDKSCHASAAAARGPSCSLGHAAVRQASPSPASQLQAIPLIPRCFWIIQPHFQPAFRVRGCEHHQPSGSRAAAFSTSLPSFSIYKWTPETNRLGRWLALSPGLSKSSS